MQTPRRKTPPLFSSSESFSSNSMKAAIGGRKGANLPVFAAVVLILLFGVVMYNEDIKSRAEFRLSTSRPSRTQLIIQQPEVIDMLPQETAKKEELQLGNYKKEEDPPNDDAKTYNNQKDKDREEEEQKIDQIMAMEDQEAEESGIELPPEGCDLFTGQWVLDNATHPLYKEDDCEFLSNQVTCLRNGRKDSLFQKWRWQPRDCSLPKFNAKLLLKKLRNKRLMYIGDSLNRNQWESMVCLAQSIVPSGKKRLSRTGSLSIFKIE
ncbi:hypothetical protein CRG98_033021, partial [Punica granatum]